MQRVTLTIKRRDLRWLYNHMLHNPNFYVGLGRVTRKQGRDADHYMELLDAILEALEPE